MPRPSSSTTHSPAANGCCPRSLGRASQDIVILKGPQELLVSCYHIPNTALEASRFEFGRRVPSFRRSSVVPQPRYPHFTGPALRRHLPLRSGGLHLLLRPRALCGSSAPHLVPGVPGPFCPSAWYAPAASTILSSPRSRSCIYWWVCFWQLLLLPLNFLPAIPPRVQTAGRQPRRVRRLPLHRGLRPATEPAWHRAARRARTKARTVLRNFISGIAVSRGLCREPSVAFKATTRPLLLCPKPLPFCRQACRTTM